MTRENKWGMHPYGTWDIYTARKDWAQVEIEIPNAIWPRPTPDIMFGTYLYIHSHLKGSMDLLLLRKDWNEGYCGNGYRQWPPAMKGQK